MNFLGFTGKYSILNVLVVISMAISGILLVGAPVAAQQTVKTPRHPPIAPGRPVTDDLYGIRVFSARSDLRRVFRGAFSLRT